MRAGDLTYGKSTAFMPLLSFNSMEGEHVGTPLRARRLHAHGQRRLSRERGYLRNGDQRMLTRQQRRAAARAKAKHPPPESKWRRAAQVALQFAKASLRFAEKLSRPLRRLPWWADVLGIAAALLAIWLVFFDTIPTIEIAGSDRTSPFELPFTVRNKSPIFDARDAQFSCQAVRIEQGPFAYGFVPLALAQHRTITWGNPVNFKCPVTTSGDPVRRAVVRIFVDYKTLFKGRTTTADFTWIGTVDPPRWIEGEIVR